MKGKVYIFCVDNSFNQVPTIVSFVKQNMSHFGALSLKDPIYFARHPNDPTRPRTPKIFATYVTFTQVPKICQNHEKSTINMMYFFYQHDPFFVTLLPKEPHFPDFVAERPPIWRYQLLYVTLN